MDKVPPFRLISSTTKFVEDSERVNVIAIEASLLVSPSFTVEDVIVIVGATESNVQLN